MCIKEIHRSKVMNGAVPLKLSVISQRTLEHRKVTLKADLSLQCVSPFAGRLTISALGDQGFYKLFDVDHRQLADKLFDGIDARRARQKYLSSGDADQKIDAQISEAFTTGLIILGVIDANTA